MSLGRRGVGTAVGASSARGAAKIVIVSSAHHGVAKVEVPSLDLPIVGTATDGMSVRIAAGRSDRSLVEVAAKAAGRSLDLRVVGKVADESSARRDVAKAMGRNGDEIATRSVLPSSDLRTAGKAVKRVPSVPNDAAPKPDPTVAEIAVPRPGLAGTGSVRPVGIVATLGRLDRNGTIKDFPGLSRRIPT